MEKFEKYRLLAEFEGAKHFRNEHYQYPHKEMHWLNAMKYDFDWTWLMPICNMIHGYGFDMMIKIGGYTQISGEKLPFLIECEADTSIEATFEACVDFIEWFNENKAK